MVQTFKRYMLKRVRKGKTLKRPIPQKNSNFKINKDNYILNKTSDIENKYFKKYEKTNKRYKKN